MAVDDNGVVMKNSTTTRRMAYMGFFVAAGLAFYGIYDNRDLTALGILCGMFLSLTGVHMIRRGFGREGELLGSCLILPTQMDFQLPWLQGWQYTTVGFMCSKEI